MGPLEKANVNDSFLSTAMHIREVAAAALTHMKATNSLTFRNTDTTCSNCCIASRNLDMRDMPRSFLAEPYRIWILFTSFLTS